CQAEVEEGADLCLECGEPMGDSPAARVARADSSVAAPGAPAASDATPDPANLGRSTAPAKSDAGSVHPSSAPRSTTPTVRGTRSPLVGEEDRDPIRCPACGTPSRAARCPACGTPLRHDD